MEFVYNLLELQCKVLVWDCFWSRRQENNVFLLKGVGADTCLLIRYWCWKAFFCHLLDFRPLVQHGEEKLGPFRPDDGPRHYVNLKNGAFGLKAGL